MCHRFPSFFFNFATILITIFNHEDDDTCFVIFLVFFLQCYCLHIRIVFEMYIKYEAFEGSPSFVENNDLDAHISSTRLS